MISGNNVLKPILKGVSEARIVLVCIAIGVAVALYPLQHHMTIGRLQHYGLALAFVGWGYLMQTVWSWRRMKRWTRIGHLTAWLYLSAAAMTIYSNPWLEPRFAVRTTAQEDMRSLIIYTFGLLAVPQLVICFLWLADESKGRRKTGSK